MKTKQPKKIKLKYKYKDRSFAVPAEVAAKELDRIKADHDGLLQPRTVVDEARPIGSPLHPVFDWDDVHAAEEWRTEQARRLIRCVHVIVEEDDSQRESPLFVNIQKHEETEQGYHSYFDVISDQAMSDRMVYQVWKELSAFKRKYENIFRDSTDKDFIAIAKMISRKEIELNL